MIRDILTHDIKAAASIATACDRHFPLWINLELAGGSHWLMFGEPSELEEKISTAASPCPRNSRIALVFDRDACHLAGNPWQVAAEKYCREQIAGVLVISQVPSATEDENHVSKNDDLIRSLEELPESFWRAAMPILYDGEGLLSRLSSKSRHLAVDDALSFAKPAKTPGGRPLLGTAKIHMRDSCVIPIVVPDSSPGQCSIIMKGAAASCLSAMNEVCRRTLADANIFPGDCGNGIGDACDDVDTLISYMGRALPESVDTESLYRLGSTDELQRAKEAADRIPYGILEPENAVALHQLRQAARKLEDACVLVASAMRSHCVMFRQEGAVDDSAEQLSELLELFGIPQQVSALSEGVPVGDLVA